MGLSSITTQYKELLQRVPKEHVEQKDLIRATGVIQTASGGGIHALNYMRNIIKKYEDNPSFTRADKGKKTPYN